MIFVTGGAGFIGSNFVVGWLACSREPLLVIDNLTYAGNLENLASVSDRPGFGFERVDICDGAALSALLRTHQPRAVLHFAAETHVDRSILGPGEFVRTNVTGTFSLLEAARAYWSGLAGDARQTFRFLHVSTDEVYGSLGPVDPPFCETSSYAPNSPYAASKAASDHLVRAYHHTYGLPTLTTNCSNNYGPYQFPEKVIPLFVTNLFDGRQVPLYGDGLNVRDWLHVEDHCRGIALALTAGVPGEIYNIGGGTELTNRQLTERLLDACAAGWERVDAVEDRKAHDRRYSVDCSKLAELGYTPKVNFDEGLAATIDWYRDNRTWWEPLRAATAR